MRKFFKSLAVLLALTLIVGVIPAAAADPLKMVDEKILYLGGSQGTKEDGTNCKTSYKKKVANMITGFDADTMNVDLKSADSSIVKATKAGRIYAKSIGTTTVTVTVYDAAETEIFKKDLKVKVKKNATEVAVTGIADGDKVKVGQSVDVALPRQGVDTDERSFTVDKPELAEITKGEKARTWTVKFLKAGEATFTARAYQSAKYPGKTAETVIKVAISNPAPTGAKVVASNAYELTFDTDVEAAGLFKDQKEIANDACYYMLNETKVTFSAVKSVKATGNTVKVTMYDNFTAGTTYYVTVNECEPIGLVIAGNAAKDVESIAILTDTVTVNTSAELKIALYNKDGVDITGSVTTTITDVVSFTSSNLNSYIDGNTLNMYNVGDETEVTATFTYYDPNNNYAEVKKTATKKVTAVPAAADVFSKLVYSIDGTRTAITENYSNAKTYVAIGDDFDFKVGVVYTNGNDKKWMVVDGVQTFNDKALIAKIPEESIALLAGAGLAGAGSYKIVPNQVGKTNVFIGYEDNGFKTIAVAPIEVKEARHAQTLTVKPGKSNLNTNVDDKITFTAEIKDQYGDPIDATLSSEQNSQSKKVATLNDLGWVKVDTGKYTLIAETYSDNNRDGNPDGGSDISYIEDATKPANIVFTTKVTDTNSKANSVGSNFTAKNAGIQKLESDAISFVNNGEKSLDTGITGTTQIKVASITATTSNNGFYTGTVGFGLLAAAPDKRDYVVAAASKGSIVYKALVMKDSTVLNNTSYPGFVSIDEANGKISIQNLKLNGTTNYIEQLPKGTYKCTLYKIKQMDNVSEVVISSQTIVVNVTNTQTPPTFTQIAEKTTVAKATDALYTASGYDGDFSDCFKFAFANKNDYNTYGTEVKYVSTKPSTATKSHFVNKALVTVSVTLKDQNSTTIASSANFDLECSINKLIKAE